MAILRYKGAPNEQPDEEETWDRQGLTMNPWNEEMSELNIPYFFMNSTGINRTDIHRYKPPRVICRAVNS